MKTTRKPRNAGRTPPRQFRLSEGTLAEIDRIARILRLETRTAVIRYAVGQLGQQVR